MRATRQAWASCRGHSAGSCGALGTLACRQGPVAVTAGAVRAQVHLWQGRGARTVAEGVIKPSEAHRSHVECDLAPGEAAPSSAPRLSRWPPPAPSSAGLRTPVPGWPPGTRLPVPQPGLLQGPGRGHLGTEGQAVGSEGSPLCASGRLTGASHHPVWRHRPGRSPGPCHLAFLPGHGLPLPLRTKQKPPAEPHLKPGHHTCRSLPRHPSCRPPARVWEAWPLRAHPSPGCVLGPVLLPPWGPSFPPSLPPLGRLPALQGRLSSVLEAQTASPCLVSTWR